MMPKISTSSFGAFVDHCLAITEKMSIEREKYLFDCLRQGDKTVIKELIVYNMRYVACVVYNMTKRSINHYPDALSHGVIGMMKAIKMYDHNFGDGMRFSGFCYPHIKNEVCEYFIRMKNIYNCSGSKDQRKLYFQIPKLTKDIKNLTLAEAEFIAEQTNTSVKDVMLTYQKIQPAVSIYNTEDDDDETSGDIWEFADERYSPDVVTQNEEHENIINESLSKGLSLLDERSRDIIVSRWLSEKKAPLHELGSKYNVSQERIRQLEANAFSKIRSSNAVKNLFCLS